MQWLYCRPELRAPSADSFDRVDSGLCSITEHFGLRLLKRYPATSINQYLAQWRSRSSDCTFLKSSCCPDKHSSSHLVDTTYCRPFHRSTIRRVDLAVLHRHLVDQLASTNQKQYEQRTCRIVGVLQERLDLLLMMQSDVLPNSRIVDGSS